MLLIFVKNIIHFGDYSSIIINELNNMGLLVLKDKLEPNIKPIPLVVDAILSEILWNMFKN